MNEYQKLHPIIQNWIFKQGWTDLRLIQKRAIEPILSREKDILISASTAAGKSEAFFLPACTSIADLKNSFGIIYISPLKALINDQYRRFEELCDMLEIGLVSWHGDSSQSKKRHFEKKPSGIILITPESLESLLIRKMNWVKSAFSSVQYIVIDEFHAFIGTERGVQLISLLNRLEVLLGRGTKKEFIPRIALSATLGDIESIPKILRPNSSVECEIIEGEESFSTIQVQLRGYIEPEKMVGSGKEIDDENPILFEQTAMEQIKKDIYRLCRGDSHLVFANSRARTESLAAALKSMSEKQRVPNEFFPHHGSLSKELRETLEKRLQKEVLPTTAICTMTLELGIDIGKVSSVIQVTPPFSVSSLRQRLGRSGRRGDPSILRMMIPEKQISKDISLYDALRLQTVQSIALIHLLVEDRWFEPPEGETYHFSTLAHQILSVIAQYGGVRADQLYTLLCKTNSPFYVVSVKQFSLLLKKLGKLDLLVQLESGELVLGLNGERMTGHYDFYSVFKTSDEYSIIFGSKKIGSIPVDYPLVEDQQIIFGGQYWKVLNIDIERKTISVNPAHKGKAPLFGGEGFNIHNRIRSKMFEIYSRKSDALRIGSQEISFLNKTAKKLFDEGVNTFYQYSLADNRIIQLGNKVYIFLWLGDKAVYTLVIMLLKLKVTAVAGYGVIEILHSTVDDIREVLRKLSNMEVTAEELASIVPNKVIEKYDEFLPNELLIQDYGKKSFRIDEVKSWINRLLDSQ